MRLARKILWVLAVAACVGFAVVGDSAGVESDDQFLLRLQRLAVNYFWVEANPANGLVRDRSRADSKCSVAAVGFGLSSIVVGIEQAWIPRDDGRRRVLTTLRTLAETRQGPESSGVSGYRGWFYHFLEMDSGHRAWKCELSTIDTALLLAGVLDVAAFFDGVDPEDVRVRALAGELVRRVDWDWMAAGQSTFSMGWHPESGFLPSRWVGYNEAMILYLLALGAPDDDAALPSVSWEAWTRGYRWTRHQGIELVEFAPMFGHQYTQCWVDFRGIADSYMKVHGLTYFENSRRATLAQQAYCMEQSRRFTNYSAREWGITACDGPAGYAARGAPPAENDDGTLAPTAVAGSLPFAPEVCIPSLRHLERTYRDRLWGPYGFRDAFNVTRNWWATDTLGIDQGPMVLMIENFRTGALWRRMQRNPILRRGLARAGFSPFPTPP